MTRSAANDPSGAAAIDEPQPLAVSEMIHQCLKAIASLKLTVALFAMSIFIVFAGTLVQVDKGIWTVVDEYFRCYITWIDLQIFFPRSMKVPGGFWFPGGWLIGGGLLVNILAAHAVRFTVKARGQKLTMGLIVLAIGIILTGLVLAGVFQQDVAATEDAAFWRVLLRLIKGGVAAGVLLVGCMMLFNKRAGIVLLHAGIILMLLSELITGLYAVEGQMRIKEGQTVNYIYHTTAFELAVIDPSDAEWNTVTAIRGPSLSTGSLIRDERLPFDIQIDQYMPNSTLVRPAQSPNLPNPATAGTGLEIIAVEQPEASGADPNQSVDVASAYVTIVDKSTGQPMGKYLLSGWISFQDLPQRITVGDTTYLAYLRFARTYKPYSVHLIDFRHETYMGTNKPKDFSAHVRLLDPSRGVDREVRIWMNNPLRYAGETFYQSSFDPDDPTVTVLQVVKNAGWMVPYVACMIVATGLTAHFGMYLVSFLRKRGTA
jgi:hypothetical protein